MYWHTLTYLGDSMLLLPTALLLSVLILIKSQRWQTSISWLITFSIAGLIVCISKILFLGFFIGSASLNFTGFSGHTSMSAVFWPVAFWLLSGGMSRCWRQLALCAGFILPALIGYSRLAIHAHSVSEVFSGYLLGTLLSGSFLWLQRNTLLTGFSTGQLLLVLVLPLLIIGKKRPASTQQFLTQLSAKLARAEHAYTREQLLSSQKAH